MTDRPLILFSRHEEAEKAKRHGGAPRFHFPDHQKQVSRLNPQFSALQTALEQGRISIQSDAQNINPEYTLVLEVAGDPAGFDTAVRKLKEEYEDVEWLFELVDDERSNDSDFYRIKKDGQVDNDKLMSYKFFCVLTNQEALNQIISLWEHYKNDPQYKFPIGKTGFRNVFKTLKDIHLWGISERLDETGILDAWREDLSDQNNSIVYCEIELFYRTNKEKRLEVQKKVEDCVRKSGGKVITAACIDEIEYHALLVEIPRQCAEEIINKKEVELIQLEQIMFFKPTGQAVVVSTDESIEYDKMVNKPTDILSEPIIAMLDGLPQENHPLLSDYIIIDDPDDFSEAYQVADRVHGTSMASLIAHGNLENYISSVSRKIYVRPIMKPYPTGRGNNQEYIPSDVLVVDKIHVAIRRLFEESAGKVAPSVRIINLSIGLGDRQFYNMISPLAKLLDWLSYKYKILFIVSAGNHQSPIDLSMPFNDFKSIDEQNKNETIIRTLNRNNRLLRLLSPAESMNALTVGALFQDDSNPAPNYRQVIPCENGMISPISSLGSGINRSIKPDLLYAGGRGILIEDIMHPSIAKWRDSGSNLPPGILSAKPVNVQAGTTSVGYSFGTSDAAAMISHNASDCYEILNEIFMEELDIGVPKEYVALLIKAMLIHGAKWGELADLLRKALGLTGRAADEVHKWIGYGIPDIERVKECTKNRITLLGYGELQQDKAHVFELPIPFSFHKEKIYRCLTVTLAYFTPVKPTTKKYRITQLWFDINDDGKKLVPDRQDASDKAVVRGTVQHERFVGNDAVVWNEDTSIKIKVNCRADADIYTGNIPYTLFVSFEVAPEMDLDVYQDILNKIQIKDKDADTITPPII